jgi:hypothetical protein
VTTTLAEPDFFRMRPDGATRHNHPISHALKFRLSLGQDAKVVILDEQDTVKLRQAYGHRAHDREPRADKPQGFTACPPGESARKCTVFDLCGPMRHFS